MVVLRVLPEVCNYYIKGYLYTSFKYKTRTLHRLIALEKFGDEAMKGLETRHTCHNRWCVNPKHIIKGTTQDNADDKVKAGRQAFVKGNAKITQEIAEKIRGDNQPYSILTEKYGLCKSTISYIKNYKTWVK